MEMQQSAVAARKHDDLNYSSCYLMNSQTLFSESKLNVHDTEKLTQLRDDILNRTSSLGIILALMLSVAVGLLLQNPCEETSCSEGVKVLHTLTWGACITCACIGVLNWANFYGHNADLPPTAETIVMLKSYPRILGGRDWTTFTVVAMFAAMAVDVTILFGLASGIIFCGFLSLVMVFYYFGDCTYCFGASIARMDGTPNWGRCSYNMFMPKALQCTFFVPAEREDAAALTKDEFRITLAEKLIYFIYGMLVPCAVAVIVVLVSKNS